MIYVCVPSHNEGTTLGPLLWKVRKVLREFGREFHLVVLDDASTDDTAEVLARYEEQLPLTVLREDERIGYGRAVDRLLREALKLSDYPKRDTAVVLQADLTDDPAYVVDLVKTAEGGVDIVAGSSPDAGPDVPKPFRWGRRLAPFVLGRSYRQAPVEDPLCGLRAYRLIVLKKALRGSDEPLTVAEEPWAANVELLRRVVGHARRVESLPLGIRYNLLDRESRFRTVPTLKRLFGLRGRAWPQVSAERSSKKRGSDANGKSPTKDAGDEQAA